MDVSPTHDIHPVSESLSSHYLPFISNRQSYRIIWFHWIWNSVKCNQQRIPSKTRGIKSTKDTIDTHWVSLCQKLKNKKTKESDWIWNKTKKMQPNMLVCKYGFQNVVWIIYRRLWDQKGAFCIPTYAYKNANVHTRRGTRSPPKTYIRHIMRKVPYDDTTYYWDTPTTPCVVCCGMENLRHIKIQTIKVFP